MRSLLATLFLLVAACVPAAAQDQASAPADSSGTRGGGLLRAIAGADSAEVDSLRADASESAKRPGYFGTWTRSASFTVDADVTLLSGTLALRASNAGSDLGLHSSYSRRDRNYRRQERDAAMTSLSGGMSAAIPSFANLQFDLSRGVLEDETQVISRTEDGPSTLQILIEDETQDARLGLRGGQDLHGPFSFAWSARAAYNEQDGSNRGTRLKTDRLEGAGGARWRFRQGPASVTARFGYDALEGTRALGQDTGDLSARRDTVGTNLELGMGEKFDLKVDVERFSFDENRLDFRHNSTGVVDTVGVAEDEKVGREHERRVTDKIGFDLKSKILPILDISSTYSHLFEELEFRFSQEGRVDDSRSNWSNTLNLRYLDDGTAALSFNYGNHWFNRRTLSDQSFRGKKFNKDYELRLTVNQALMSALSLRLTMTQDLSQSIPTDPTASDNSDRFSEILDGRLEADPFDNLTLTFNGTLKRTDYINLDANRVGENREDRLFDVRGGYTWDLSRMLHLEQVYRMEILFKDFHQSDDRDQFNKSGHLNSTLKWAPPPGGAQSRPRFAPTFEFRHEVDFRESGTRDPIADPYSTLYSRSLRKFDHLLRGTISLPWRGIIARVVSEHGIITEKNPSTGVEKEDKDYGAVNYRLSGKKTLRGGLAKLELDVTRVVQYGDRIREEQQRFWEAASTLTVNF